jgi:hypothetical protein
VEQVDVQLPEIQENSWATCNITGSAIYRFNGRADIEVLAPEAQLHHIWLNDPESAHKGIALLLMTLIAQDRAYRAEKDKKVLAPGDLAQHAAEYQAVLHDLASRSKM